MIEITKALNEYVPLFQTILWWLVLVVSIFIFKKSITSLIGTLENRIEKGASLKVAGMELGESEFNTTTEDAKKAHPDDFKLYGNPDHLKLLFKASTKTWSNSTKALQTPNGCLVQVTNEQMQSDGAWIASEALTFIPDVVIQDEPDGNGRYLAAMSSEKKNDIS